MEDEAVEVWDPKGAIAVSKMPMAEIDHLEPDQSSPPVGSSFVERESAKLLAEGAFDDLKDKRVLRLTDAALTEVLRDSKISLEDARRAYLSACPERAGKTGF